MIFLEVQVFLLACSPIIVKLWCLIGEGSNWGRRATVLKSGVYRVIRYGTMIVYMWDLMDFRMIGEQFR